MRRNGKILKLALIALAVIVIIVAIVCMVVAKNKKGASGEDSLNSTKQIRVDEDFNKDGIVENLDNVRWSHARIMQHDDKMEVSIYLNNESKEEKVEARQLKVNLFDKNNKVIFSKDLQMEEIPANYGYTSLDFEFDIEDITVIYDIEIIAK